MQNTKRETDSNKTTTRRTTTITTRTTRTTRTKMTILTDDQTREYLKLQPATVPSDIGYYQNVINTRQYTLANLNHYVKLSSGINTYGWIGSILTNKTYPLIFLLPKRAIFFGGQNCNTM